MASVPLVRIAVTINAQYYPVASSRPSAVQLPSLIFNDNHHLLDSRRLTVRVANGVYAVVRDSLLLLASSNMLATVYSVQSMNISIMQLTATIPSL